MLYRLAPMWQQSGTLLFGSCHEIAGFFVVELQISIWCHFLEVHLKKPLHFFQKRMNHLCLNLKMRSNIEYSCHTNYNDQH